MENEFEIDMSGISEDLEAFHEDVMVQEALHRGVDLKLYADELAGELREAEMETVKQYVANSDEVISLHRQMQECDGVLARMQEMLLGFQVDLGGISEEIKYLQDESQSMSVRLKNRRAVEEKLRYFLDNANISPQHGKAILEGTVNESFMEAVAAVCEKLKFLKEDAKRANCERENSDKNSDDGRTEPQLIIAETFAGRNLLPQMQRLKERALGVLRDYFAGQFAALRKPKTNVQILQQNALVKYAPLFALLRQERPPIAEELKTVYIESMSRTMLSLFKAYFTALLKLDSKVAPKGTVLGADEGLGGRRRSIFRGSGGGSNSGDRGGGGADDNGASLFSASDRQNVIDDVEAEPILLHVAIAENQKYTYDVLLRSVLKHLVDAASSEFLFLLDFFKSNARDNFNRIFGKVLSLVLEKLENHMLQCHDMVGLLLMIRIAHALRLVMQRRRIPILDSFFDRVSMLLWPRLKHVLEANLTSLRNADAKRLAHAVLGPHFVSRRYGEMVASIVTLQGASGGTGGDVTTGSTQRSSLSSGAISNGMDGDILVSASLGIAGGGEAMLAQDVSLLRSAMTGLLERLAEQLVSVRERRVFLINNLDCILRILQDRKVGMCDEANHLEDLLLEQKALYTEEELKLSFGKLTSFVVQTERSVSDSGASSARSKAKGAKLELDSAVVEALVKEFAGTWRIAIQSIHDNVVGYFGDSRNGMEVLKQVLTQMLMYYTRFQDLVKQAWAKTPPFARDIVSTSTILMEIKRYSRVS